MTNTTAAPSAILLVEDNPDDVMFLERAFEKTGCPISLRAIADGQEAVDYLAGAGRYSDRKEHPLPNRVLLDLKLPHRSGLEILDWLRGRPDLKAMSVIVLTSSSEGPDRERAAELGIDGYFVKPVSHAELVTVVRQIAALWRLPLRAADDVHAVGGTPPP